MFDGVLNTPLILVLKYLKKLPGEHLWQNLITKADNTVLKNTSRDLLLNVYFQ